MKSEENILFILNSFFSGLNLGLYILLPEHPILNLILAGLNGMVAVVLYVYCYKGNK